MFELISSFRDFLDKGGDVLYAILFVAIWLWWLIFERYWYFLCEHKKQVQQQLESWQARSDQSSWFATMQRASLISVVDLKMLNNLRLIPVLIALLPMFGLLAL